MSKAQATKTIEVDLDTLVDIIRQVVREEVARAMTSSPEELGIVYLEPDSPLYQDMVEIKRLAEQGAIQVMSRDRALRDIE